MNTSDWWPCDLQTTAMAMYDDLLAFSGFPAPSSLLVHYYGFCVSKNKNQIIYVVHALLLIDL